MLIDAHWCKLLGSHPAFVLFRGQVRKISAITSHLIGVFRVFLQILVSTEIVSSSRKDVNEGRIFSMCHQAHLLSLTANQFSKTILRLPTTKLNTVLQCTVCNCAAQGNQMYMLAFDFCNASVIMSFNKHLSTHFTFRDTDFQNNCIVRGNCYTSVNIQIVTYHRETSNVNWHLSSSVNSRGWVIIQLLYVYIRLYTSLGHSTHIVHES